MSLLEKMQKASKLKEASILSQSNLFGQKDSISTDIPILNLAFSGSLDGGYQSGLTMFAGPSKHFKTLFGLIAMKAYLKKYPDAIALFYDSEFGTPEAYFESLDIPTDRVLHLPIVDIEELTFDAVQKLNELERGERVFIFIDSLGNLASKKEATDALDGKAVADMTRAKMLKSFFRIVTPHLTKKDIPMFVINHTYKSISFIPSDVVGGGCVIAGTKIKMADGRLLNIEDINTGNIVLTSDGPKEVTHTWNPETLLDGNPECYEVEFEDGSKIVCSENHRFKNANGYWAYVESLSPGDELLKVD